MLSNEDITVIAISFAVGVGCLTGAMAYSHGENMATLVGFGSALTSGPLAFMVIYKLR